MTDSCNSMSEYHTYNIEQNKQHTEEFLYVSMARNVQNMQNVWWEQKQWLTLGRCWLKRKKREPLGGEGKFYILILDLFAGTYLCRKNYQALLMCLLIEAIV